eukprot:Phypoly_transcript_21783.p1 GENE.Phypoly_transcript_21783~~Phypoly_transcript_21783.p1  ORF type:complete len:202 (+),score=30.23 Phypoly_transcript_21783:36-608(+)
MKNILILVTLLSLASVGFCTIQEFPFYLVVVGVGLPNPLVGSAIGVAPPLAATTTFAPEVGFVFEQRNLTGPAAQWLSDYNANTPSDHGNITFSHNSDGTANLISFNLISYFTTDQTQSVFYATGSYTITGGSGAFKDATGFLGFTTKQLGPETNSAYTQWFTGIILLDVATPSQATKAETVLAPFSQRV